MTTMPNKTLTHDPDEGCYSARTAGCPFLGDEFSLCQALKSKEQPDGRHIPGGPTPEVPYPPAPDWCPLRSGPAIVMTPAQDDRPTRACSCAWMVLPPPPCEVDGCECAPIAAEAAGMLGYVVCEACIGREMDAARKRDVEVDLAEYIRILERAEEVRDSGPIGDAIVGLAGSLPSIVDLARIVDDDEGGETVVHLGPLVREMAALGATDIHVTLDTLPVDLVDDDDEGDR